MGRQRDSVRLAAPPLETLIPTFGKISQPFGMMNKSFDLAI
ncbi:MAG: hypothetical protein VYE13_05755 [Pseudomonadota bacterium]|nr:hypothetical protein [Pseudomonadota bacterium]